MTNYAKIFLILIATKSNQNSSHKQAHDLDNEASFQLFTCCCDINSASFHFLASFQNSIPRTRFLLIFLLQIHRTLVEF